MQETPLPSPESEPGIAVVILSGASEQLDHGLLCEGPMMKLQCNGPRRRLVCVSCEHFVELPIGDDYDAAWKAIGERPVIEPNIHALPPPVTLREDKPVARPADQCFHGVPFSRDCPRCLADEGKAFGHRLTTAPLGGRILPPDVRGS